MRIEQLRAPSGANRKKKRLGRGVGSGHGKTSGRGNKGAGSRSGTTRKPGFEGGQMPLIRRIPKRGFHNKFKQEYQVINVKSLNVFPSGSVVEPGSLHAAGLIKSQRLPVKILGDGELKPALTVRAGAFSAQAREKIARAKGKTEIIAAAGTGGGKNK